MSFGEVLVLVTGAGILLGRREIVEGSRMLGKGLGRVIGIATGVRRRYDEKSAGTRLYQVHSQVNRGLADMSVIGRDLYMVGKMGSSAAIPPPRSGDNSSTSMPSQQIPMGNSTAVLDPQMATSTSAPSDVEMDAPSFEGIEINDESIAAYNRAIMENQAIVQQEAAKKQNTLLTQEEVDNIVNIRLAQFVLAEQERQQSPESKSYADLALNENILLKALEDIRLQKDSMEKDDRKE